MSWTLIKTCSLYLQSALYILAGFNHFRVPRLYLKLMPPYIPAQDFLIAGSGAVEILLGILMLIPLSRSFALLLVAVMLSVYLPLHIYSVQIAPFKLGGMNVTREAALLRLFFQIPLILWALWQGGFLQNVNK